MEFTRDLILCIDGPAELPQHDSGRLSKHGIREERTSRLEKGPTEFSSRFSPAAAILWWFRFTA